MKVKKLGKEDLVIKPPEIHAVRFPCLHYALHFMQESKVASQLHLKGEGKK